MMFILSIVFIVIGAVMTFLGGYCLNQYHSEKSNKKSEVLSHQSRPRDLPNIKSFPAVVLAGTMALIFRPGTSLTLSNVSPYMIEAKEDGRILLRGDFRDSSGVVVASLRGTNLLISPGKKYDINSDVGAIEVVNDNLHPVLQIWKASDQELEILEKKYREIEKDQKDHGKLTDHLTPIFKALSCHEVLMTRYVNYHAFETNKNIVQVEIADSQGITITSDIPSVIQRINGIKRLFEYPGNESPGVRRGD